MRVKQPEPFDPNREYNPGERCVYRGMVLIAEIWTAAGCTISQQQPRNIYATLRSLQNPKGRLPRNR